ncbi:anti-sigma factor [Thiomonas sp.]|jgi:anti-sigma-K factor RskA|uniref:anti-sigma factor n=1 Tax=Thiomonas sp. TaxID=2047785 RepID=UPI0017584739|nr:anti-sigma factor [Thiomonas sp.]
MSLPTRYTRPELLDRLAADWLTGGLSLAAQRRARRLVDQSPAFAQAVQRWQERFDASLLSAAEYGQPSEKVWQAIAARITIGTTQTAVGAAASGGWSVRAWQRLAALFGGVAAAAVALSMFLLLAPRHEHTSAAMTVQVAALLHGQTGQAAVVTVQDDALTFTAVGSLAVPAGKSYQLWLLPTQGAPVSLGIVTAGKSRYLLSPEALERLSAVKAFAVSVEPAGGSPTGQPTGPVIMAGAAQKA